MKRLVSLFLVTLLILQSFCIYAFSVGGNSSPKHIPRIVSVVFDNSGSMYNETDRWAYTSYAMQAFVAMMGKDDALNITYLNESGYDSAKEILLSGSGKQVTIDAIENVMFGGGTPNKLSAGSAFLKNKYLNYGTNAKYYLVVMADGDLDKGQGDMATDLSNETTATRKALAGADFESIYFSMYGSLSINGVNCQEASNSKAIVEVLKDISAEIMGRTTIESSGSGSKISFDLKYPALNIAVFVQKENAAFSNVNVPITYNGNNASYETNTYYLECPTVVNKNPNKKIYEEKIPSSPPSGFVSLISNGNNSVPKGFYTLDLSSYGVSKNDVIILVEPAVKVDCKYFIGDSTEPVSFDELKKTVCAGDKISVQCGLYEINSDGTSGEPVPLDVLKPDYKLYINDTPVGKKISGSENEYTIDIVEDYANQELKIEAVLKGYQPFVLKENFDDIRQRANPNLPDGKNSFDVTLTKPEWEEWLNSESEISFPLDYADSSMLADLSIRTEGADFLPSGNCSKLSNISISGNSIVYNPTPASSTEFKDIPQNFTVELYDNVTASTVIKAEVNVIQPKYKFECANGLADVTLGIEMLKNNTLGVRFVLCADYTDSGIYTPIKDSSCEPEIEIALNHGALPGTISEEQGEISFVPVYDSDINTDISPAEVLGNEHRISASATVDGAEITSDEIILSVNNASYKIEIDNQITEPLDLTTINGNKKKVIFNILADYTGEGEFGPVAEWDYSVFDKFEIDSGDLPGKTEKEHDASGRPTGVSFTPDYDENNNNGVPFTKVAGKNHSIVCGVTAFNIAAGTTVEVLPPIYEILVKKTGIKLIDTKLRKNEQGVEFVITRNGHVLTKAELEGLAPYQFSLDKEQHWVKIEGIAMDGYLLCVPKYDGWTFISPALWNWLCIFTVRKGDTAINLHVGENTAQAAMHINLDVFSLIIFLIVLGITLFILWIIFCFITRVRFSPGTFYKVSFRPNTNNIGYVFSSVSRIKPSKGELRRFLFSGKFFIPFSQQSRKISFGTKEHANFKTASGSHEKHTFPYANTAGEIKGRINRGHLTRQQIQKIINGDRTDFSISSTSLAGKACGKEKIKMALGVFLIENHSRANTIVFYVTKKNERKFKNKKSRNKKSVSKKDTRSKSKRVSSNRKSSKNAKIVKTKKKF